MAFAGAVVKGLFVGSCGVDMGFFIIFCILLPTRGDLMGDDSFSESATELLLEGITLLGGFKLATCGFVCAKGSEKNLRQLKLLSLFG